MRSRQLSLESQSLNGGTRRSTDTGSEADFDTRSQGSRIPSRRQSVMSQESTQHSMRSSVPPRSSMGSIQSSLHSQTSERSNSRSSNGVSTVSSRHSLHSSVSAMSARESIESHRSVGSDETSPVPMDVASSRRSSGATLVEGHTPSD